MQESPGSEAERRWCEPGVSSSAGHLSTCLRCAPTVSVLRAPSPHPAGDQLILLSAVAAGSPWTARGESASGGWPWIATLSGAGGATLCAGDPTRLPGRYSLLLFAPASFPGTLFSPDPRDLQNASFNLGTSGESPPQP